MAGGADLHVIDIDNTSPQYLQIIGSVEGVGTIPHWGGRTGLAVVDNYAYVACYLGLKIVDVSINGPESLQIVGSVPGHAYDVSVSGSYAYVAMNGLTVVDVTDPTFPQSVGNLWLGAAIALAVSGSCAYVLDGNHNGGLQVIDITIPSSPQPVGGIDLPSGYQRVILDESFVYIATASLSSPPMSGSLEIAWKQCYGTVAIEDDPEETISDEELPSVGLHLAVYPNPFNPQTTISFTLVRSGLVEVGVYSLTGRQVAVLTERTFATGPHTLTWNGQDDYGRAMPSGSYVIRLETEERTEARKVMLVR